MKKIFVITLTTILLISCSVDVSVSTNDIENNVKECIKNLQMDTYIRACDDIKIETENYFKLIEETNQQIDFTIYDSLLSDLLVITDVSQNHDIKLSANILHMDIIDMLTPKLNDHKIYNYKDVKDKKVYENIANNIITSTTLKYQDTQRQRIAYNNQQVIYKSTFLDENMIILDYYTDDKGDLKYIEIHSNNNDQNIYLNFARLYTFKIITNQDMTLRNIANHDSLLVERKLQFFNDEDFLNPLFDIEVVDKTIILTPAKPRD